MWSDDRYGPDFNAILDTEGGIARRVLQTLWKSLNATHMDHTMHKKILFVLITALWLPAANAGLMRLDFAGTIVGSLPHDGGSPTGQYSGYFILDTSALDSDSSISRGFYSDGLVEGSITWNGNASVFSVADAIVVRNDASLFNDLFSVVVSGPEVADVPFLLAFQLGDSSSTAFSDDGLPTELNLTDFDPLDLDNVNATGVFAVVNSQQVQATIDSLSYTPIPLPGALVLMGSGLLGMRFFSRWKSAVG